MADDSNSSVVFTLQMAFEKKHINVDQCSLTMTSLIDMACNFVDLQFPEHRKRDLKSCLNLFVHNLTSDNLSLVTNSNLNLLQNSTVEIVIIDKTDTSNTLKIQPHQLYVHSYKSPHFCDYCDVMLFGLIQQGLKCSGCGMNFHKRCAYKIPNNCQRTRKKRSKDSSSNASSNSSSSYSNHAASITSSSASGAAGSAGSASLTPSCSSSACIHYDNNLTSAASCYRNVQSVSQYGNASNAIAPPPSSSSSCSSTPATPTSAASASSAAFSSNNGVGSTSPSVSKKNGDVAQIHGRPIAIEHDVHNRIKIPHTFVIHSYKRPTVCKHCKNLLYGLYKQGYRCKDCYFNCHKKCAPLVPKNCQGEIEFSKPDEVIYSDDDDGNEMSPKLTTGGNVPLQRLVESIRRPMRSVNTSANIVKECWMVHFTNTKHERLSYYWRLSTKSISIFLSEKHKKPIKEIQLNEILNIEISKDPQAIDATRNPHIFEITIDANQIYYVGENLPAALSSSSIHPSAHKTPSESCAQLAAANIKSTTSTKTVRASTGTTTTDNTSSSASQAPSTAAMNSFLAGTATATKGSGEKAALTLQLAIRTAMAANQGNKEVQRDEIKPSVDQPKEDKVCTIIEESSVEKRDVEKHYKMYSDDVLGSGQFGTVFGGIHRITNKEVAIKIIEKIRFTNKLETELKNEVNILQNLKHSGVVNLDEMFETETKIFVVMEKLHGDMLEMILNSEMKRFPERLTKFFVSQILVALRYLHSKCIVHCDLKPENVLLASNSEFPQIKLCDFGFARIIGEKSFRRSVVGTPAYLPPEVLQSKGYNRSLDMWSVGVIVYVSLSGTFPFNDDEEIVEQITNASFMYPPNPWNTLSKDATEIVRQLLNVNTLARLTVVGALRHSWISEDYQCWADLRTLEKKTNERYLTNPLDDERWEKYYETNNLDHWSVVGQTSLSSSDYELHHDHYNADNDEDEGVDDGEDEDDEAVRRGRSGGSGGASSGRGEQQGYRSSDNTATTATC